MAFTYKAEVVEDGKLHLDIFDPHLVKGEQLTIKVTRPPKHPRKANLKRDWDKIRRSFATYNPFKGMTKEQILAELRRQREEMDYSDMEKIRQEILQTRREMGYEAN